MSKKSAIVLLSLISFCIGCAVNPITGGQQLMFFPEEHDLQIGRQYAPEVEKQMGGAIANNRLQNYVNYVGQKIARVSHRADWEYHYAALEDKSVNAFALPGGYIYVTRGMLENLATEAQLAAILAHETTHVVARHSSAAMSRDIGIALLISAVSTENTPGSVATVADLTRQILGLRYSRQDEREADLGGLDYMVKAGYNPYGMVETMQMLENQQKFRTVEFLSTHPSPENRVGYITEAIQAKYTNAGALSTGKEDYRTNVLQQLGK